MEPQPHSRYLLGSRRSARALRGAAYASAALAGLLIAVVVYAYTVPLAPLEERIAPPGTVVLDSRGEILHRETADGLRIPVGLDQVAPVMVAATLAAEDQRFREHPGVDPVAIARTITQLPDPASGASTITQQLARRVYLRDSGLPLPLRKAREALIAFQIEARYSKDEILTAYLNDVYYGRGAYGVEAAARVYFGVSAAHLDLPQASLLAALPRLPGAADPIEHPDAARERQRYVLDRLVGEWSITPEQADAALETALTLLPAEPEPVAPHAIAYVFDELRRIDPELAGEDGLVIETTLDAVLQAEALRAVRVRLPELADQGASNAAVLVLDPADGRVLAMVGGGDPAGPAGQVNLALAPRQPGSTLKPLLYLAALEDGYTAASPLLDVPTTFSSDGGPYAPVNYDLHYHGQLSLRTALASSLNIPAVRTLDDVGLDAFIGMSQRLGLHSLAATEAYGLALTLGGGEVPLIELTAAYGSLANGGHVVEPYTIVRVYDREGRLRYERPPAESVRVLAPEDAFLIADILSDPVARSATFGEGSALDTPFGAAVKTGTSSAFRDAWTVGFTPDRVVGVWVGNPDGTPMQAVSGSTAAGPIWREVLGAAVDGLPRRDFEPPPGLTRASVCAPTGLAPGADCPSPVVEWFVEGSQPSAVEDYYARDANGRLLASPPSAAQPWSLDAAVALGPSNSGDATIQVLQPSPGAVLFIAPELPEQQVVLRAAVPPGTRRVEFRVDGALAGSVEGEDARMLWQLEPGAHELEVIAELPDGRIARVSSEYEVRERGTR